MEKIEKNYKVALKSGAEVVFSVSISDIHDTQDVDGVVIDNGIQTVENIEIAIVKGGRKLMNVRTTRKDIAIHERAGQKGFFMACGFAAINDAEAIKAMEAIIAEIKSLQTKQEAGQEAEKAEAEKAEAAEIVKQAEEQDEILTRAEIAKKQAVYNNAMNEGGTGYIPACGISKEEYEAAKAKLNA